MNPRISVVVATYRRPELLIRAVSSILASDHDSFELIVVDQNEQSDLEKLFADPRLKVVLTPPVGASAARNLGRGRRSAN